MKNKNRLDYQAQLSRHDHDISAGYFHTLSTGMIIPQYFHILGPGDSIYYSNHLFARLQNVVTAFRGEIDIHLESFFVPLQMIYTPFGQIFAQTDDYLTSLYHNLSERQGFPLIPFDDDHGAGSGEHFPTARPIDTFAGHIECVGKEYTRLLDAFDMNPFHACKWAVPESVEPIDPQLCYMPSCSPWIPAAYQAIYQKCFRNDEFERFSIADYNIDQYFSTGWVINDRIMRLRYAQRPSDYFTTARVSPIASAVNQIGGGASSDSELFPNNGGSLSFNLANVDNFLGFGRSSGNEFDFVKYPNDQVARGTTSFEDSSVYNQFDTEFGSNLTVVSAANIRALFAVDKFARIWGRADKTYDDQILAHFGIKIPHDVKHDLTRLKHWHVVLQSDPIYGTANITDSNSELISTIGQVGAQGQCDLNTDQEKFTAPVHGVFMIVAYAVTKPRYFGTFSKLHLLSRRLSFPIPEFDKLGAQPLYSFETDPSVLYELDADVGGSLPLTRIAWQNRYQEFKKKYNRISMTYMDPQEIQEHTPSGTHINVFAPWALSRVPFRGLQNAFNVSQLMPGTAFWERPNALNVVMEVPYDRRWSNDYYTNPHRMFETDPIIMDYMCNAKLVSWMSETGEPDL